MKLRSLLALIVAAITLSGVTSCTADSDNAMDPVWGPQCPPGYVDSCDGSGCSCKKA